MRKCANCDGDMKRGLAPSQVTIDGVTVTADLPSWTCQKCGETYFVGTTLESFQLTAAEAFGRLGLVSGHVLKFMRKTLGMRATDLASLLGVTPETVSRWETGKHVIERAVMVIVTSLVMSRLGHKTDAEDLLKTYQNPSRPIEPIQVKMAS